MATRTGMADLPLHHGRVPQWLAGRMARLTAAVSEAVIEHHGHAGLLARLADPGWFQSLGAVAGMDWHSSGITTATLGALKRGLAPHSTRLGVHVLGGRGGHMRKVPAEVDAVASGADGGGRRRGVDPDALKQTSRLVARVDNNCLQDGHELYLHGLVVTDAGHWTVVQQGMNGALGTARRYHWHGAGVASFVEPERPVIGEPQGDPLTNLADREARRARDVIVASLDQDLEQLARQVADARAADDDARTGSRPSLREGGGDAAEGRAKARPDATPQLVLPGHHDVRATDVDLGRLAGTLELAHRAAPAEFQTLLLTPGVGARTLAALALVAEVVHGAPSRFRDPARFAFAHGGKDGHPYGVPLAVYDRTLAELERLVRRSKATHDDRDDALRTLHRRARELERMVPPADPGAVVADERAQAVRYRSRSVGGAKRKGTDGLSPVPPRGSGTRRDRRKPVRRTAPVTPPEQGELF